MNLLLPTGSDLEGEEEEKRNMEPNTVDLVEGEESKIIGE